MLLVVVFAGETLGWWETGEDDLSDALTSWVPMIGFILSGALILWRSEASRIGWLLGALGCAGIAAGVAGGIGDSGQLAGQAVGGALWLGWIVATPLLIAWFPTGRVASPGWRWLERGLFTLVALTFLSYTFTEQLCLDWDDTLGCQVQAPNPIGIPGVPNPEFGSTSGALVTFTAVGFLLAVVSLVVRIVRAKGQERQQLKWFLLAGVLVLVGLTLEVTVEALGINPVPFWADFITSAGLLLLPVSVILAILKYRLYDIDRIISRTVGYLMVVVLLGGVFALGVVAIPNLVVGTGSSPAWVVAASTLAVAALFNPIRKRVLILVDRRFNRSRYNAQGVVESFTSNLRDEVDTDPIIDGWVGVVSETMQPSAVGVWVRW
jgi:hypothetical protein